MYDLLFRNATIVDGSGQKPYRSDLAVQADKISAVRDLSNAEADRVIDATGLVLSPGFVDIHGHSDYHILVCPPAHSKVRQGVTTEVTGNCGYSGAPIRGDMATERRQSLQRSLELKVEFSDWVPFMDSIKDCKPAINVAPQIGFNTTRASVMAYSADAPDDAELKKMRSEIETAMDAGAFGMSVGLIYPPACYAKVDELAACAEVVAGAGGILSAHIRSEGFELIEAIEEIVEVAERSGAALQVSHLKTSGKANWSKLDRVFEIIESAQSRGMTVRADRYPYLASFTGLSAVLPDWVYEGGKDNYQSRLSDKDQRQRMLDEITERHPEKDYWDSIVISQVFTDSNRSLEGQSVAAATDQAKREPIDFVCELLLSEPDGVSAAFHSMSEDNLERIIKKDWVMVGSDAAVRSHEGVLNEGKPHPRAYGTFPRVVSWMVREKSWLDLATAIRKMTGDPCHALGISDRGIIKEDNFADLVLFDSEIVQDTATFEDPHSYPQGIEMVVVNGQITVENGKNTGATAGKVLRMEKR